MSGPLRLVDGCKSHGDELQDVGVIQGRARRAGGDTVMEDERIEIAQAIAGDQSPVDRNAHA